MTTSKQKPETRGFIPEAERLALIAKRRNKETLRDGNVVGAYFIPIGRGFGWSTTLEHLAQAAQDSGAFCFDGTQQVIELVLEPSSASPMAQVEAAVEACRRFAPFRGLVGIRLDGWEKQLDSPELQSLIVYAWTHRDHIIFVFGAYCDDERKLDDLFNALSPRLSVRWVEPDKLTAELLAAKVGEYLRDNGFELDKRCGAGLLEMTRTAMSGASFHGYNTAIIIAEDLLHRAVERGVRKRIPAGLISDYAGSELFNTRCNGTDRHTPSGFGF